MSDLTDAVARAHRLALIHQSIGRIQCTCGEWTTTRGMTEGMDDVQGRHVAEVTEAAVREQVMVRMAPFNSLPLLMYVTEWRDALDTARAVARGEFA